MYCNRIASGIKNVPFRLPKTKSRFPVEPHNIGHDAPLCPGTDYFRRVSVDRMCSVEPTILPIHLLFLLLRRCRFEFSGLDGFRKSSSGTRYQRYRTLVPGALFSRIMDPPARPPAFHPTLSALVPPCPTLSWLSGRCTTKLVRHSTA